MTHTDNNSTDGSSISSAFEHHNADSSDNFLKIDAGGIIGFFERFPMWLKLLFLTLIAACIIFAFGGWLIGLQGSIVSEALKVRQFNLQFQLTANLVRTLQNERGKVVMFLKFPTSYNSDSLLQSQKDTDLQNLAFMQSSWFKAGTPMDLVQYQQLVQMRSKIANQQVDPQAVFNWYCDCVHIFLRLISQKSKEDKRQQTIDNQFLYLELVDFVGKIRGFGSLSFSNSNITLNSSYYNTFLTYATERTTAINLWMATATSEQVDLFNKTVLQLPEFASTMNMENYAFSQPISAFSSSVDPVEWATQKSVVFKADYVVFNAVLEHGDSATLKSYVDSIVLITVICILVVVFIVLYAMLSFCFSKTIIGPWVRMNKLQEMVTYKFVPRGFLRMIGCDSIMNVEIGKHSTKPLVFMKICIRDYWQQVDHLTVENRIMYTNRFYDTIHPFLRAYGGYIDTMSSDELQVCFKTAGSAVTCAKKIHHTIKSLNMSDFAPLNLTIAIHAASQANLAVIGDQDRLQGVVISRCAYELRQILSIGRRFQCKTVISNSLLELLSEKLDDAQLVALIGGKSNLIMYEISGKMAKNEREQFSKAVRDLYVDHNLVDAVNFFRSSENIISTFYSKVCSQLLDQCKFEIANLSVEDVLKEPLLEGTLEQACKREQSPENLELYKNIRLFKEAWMKVDSANQYKSISSIKDLIEQANITDVLKQTLVKMFNDPETWNENMFNALEVEILVLLTDTFKRLKTSDIFRRIYIKCKGMKSDLLEERLEMS